MLVYEAPLLRNLTTRDLPLMLISGSDVRQYFNLDRDSFVDFALLLGSDFSPRLHGLGPSRAIKLIQSEGSIEGVLRSERAKTTGRKFLPEPRLSEEEYLKQVEAGRSVFQSLPPISDELKADVVRQRDVDQDAVVEILRGFDLNSEVWREKEWFNHLDVDYFAVEATGLHDASYSYI